ncbi:MAG: hypothetical protein E7337_15720 [Clostridiales bacterium]|nr:hypothetical protein [Clostridiales bacterium]
MKIYDFDEKFFEYVRTWIALHPGMSEKQIEASYNEMMENWLNAPAKWLDGQTPATYFDRYSEPKDLMKLVEEYDKRDIGLPEPLFSRIVSLGETCAPALIRIAANEDRPESLRASCIGMLRDIGTDAPHDMYVDLVCNSKKENDLSEMAADILAAGDGSDIGLLLDRYDSATEYGQTLILDICRFFPGDERIYEHCMEKLRNRPEQRALYASYLAKLGDPRAVETLVKMMQMTDISYLDYIELRNAVEALGGDAGEERTFYGDPDYEAMRNI